MAGPIGAEWGTVLQPSSARSWSPTEETPPSPISSTETQWWSRSNKFSSFTAPPHSPAPWTGQTTSPTRTNQPQVDDSLTNCELNDEFPQPPAQLLSALVGSVDQLTLKIAHLEEALDAKNSKSEDNIGQRLLVDRSVIQHLFTGVEQRLESKSAQVQAMMCTFEKQVSATSSLVQQAVSDMQKGLEAERDQVDVVIRKLDESLEADRSQIQQAVDDVQKKMDADRAKVERIVDEMWTKLCAGRGRVEDMALETDGVPRTDRSQVSDTIAPLEKEAGAQNSQATDIANGSKWKMQPRDSQTSGVISKLTAELSSHGDQAKDVTNKLEKKLATSISQVHRAVDDIKKKLDASSNQLRGMDSIFEKKLSESKSQVLAVLGTAEQSLAEHSNQVKEVAASNRVLVAIIKEVVQSRMADVELEITKVSGQVKAMTEKCGRERDDAVTDQITQLNAQLKQMGSQLDSAIEACDSSSSKRVEDLHLRPVRQEGVDDILSAFKDAVGDIHGVGQSLKQIEKDAKNANIGASKVRKDLHLFRELFEGKIKTNDETVKDICTKIAVLKDALQAKTTSAQKDEIRTAESICTKIDELETGLRVKLASIERDTLDRKVLAALQTDVSEFLWNQAADQGIKQYNDEARILNFRAEQELDRVVPLQVLMQNDRTGSRGIPMLPSEALLPTNLRQIWLTLKHGPYRVALLTELHRLYKTTGWQKWGRNDTAEASFTSIPSAEHQSLLEAVTLEPEIALDELLRKLGMDVKTVKLNMRGLDQLRSDEVASAARSPFKRCLKRPAALKVMGFEKEEEHREETKMMLPAPPWAQPMAMPPPIVPPALIQPDDGGFKIRGNSAGRSSVRTDLSGSPVAKRARFE